LPAVPVAPIGAHQLLLFLIQVGLLLALALALGRLAARIGMPAVVGELCAGVVAGPSVLAHVAPELHRWLLPPDPAQFHLLDAVGQVGVVLLVGITGVHMDLGLVRRRGTTAVRVSVAGMVVPVALGVVTGLLLPDSLMADPADRGAFALFVGVAMGVSAIPVIAKTLTEMRLLHRNVGQLTLCAAMVDDIVGWVLLSVVSAMVTAGVRGGAVALPAGCLLAVLAVAALARPLVRAGLRAAARSADGGPTVMLVAAMVLLAAAATQAARLEAVFGAFVCGIVIGSCGTLDKDKLAPLSTVVMSVLAPVFFATAGLRIDLTALTDPVILLTGVCVLVIAVAGKFAGAYLGGRLSRLGHWESLALGAGMNARGVIEIIIAMVGLRLGVLSPEMYTIIVLVAVATSLVAGPLLRLTMARVEHTAEERLRVTMYGRGSSVAE
jgi:Kef-type K+ transport system membrane component KefB